MPARNARFDLHVGMRMRYPVEVHAVAGGELESNGIDFSDYVRMGRMQQKLDKCRRQATPTWVLNQSMLRAVLVRYLEMRAFRVVPFPIDPNLSESERLRRAEKALEAAIPAKEALLTRLIKECLALKKKGADAARLKKLAVQIENVDTVLVLNKNVASKAAMVVHLYYGLGLSSVDVATEVGIKPPHCRVMLWRLRKVAASLGYGEAPRRERARRSGSVPCTAARQAIVSSPEFIALFEQSRLRLADQSRKTCVRGHKICAANAHVGDMRRLGKYFCNECQKIYQRGYETSAPKLAARISQSQS